MSKQKKSNNLILQKTDLVLIKKSEETKNTEIYGNMHECLKIYDTLSRNQLKQDIAFDDKARLSLLHDIKGMLNHVKEEWYAKSSFEVTDKEMHCQLCGRKNVYICYIKNRINGEELHVGSECVKKYKDINDAGVVISKVNLYQRDKKKESRRIEFDVALGEYIDFTKISDNKIEHFPMLLPYKLYDDLKKIIITCNRIRTSYISAGGNLNECIDKFNLKREEFNKIYEKAKSYYEKNKNNSLLCTREIADWLLKNDYKTVIMNIQKANGILNEDTLKFVYEPNFIRKNLSIFENCLKQKDVHFLGLEGGVIRFKIQNNRFRNSIVFTMAIKDFMKRIGCHCLTQNGYKFGKKDLSAKIEINSQNIRNIYDYYVDVLTGTDYTLILEQRVSKYYWEKRQRITSNWSVHTREAAPVYKVVTLDRLCNIMEYILFFDEKSEKEISKIIIDKIKSVGSWITKEEKNRGVKIASEAAGMQKQREFIPYV